jgi:hypothetical protein
MMCASLRARAEIFTQNSGKNKKPPPEKGSLPVPQARPRALT